MNFRSRDKFSIRFSKICFVCDKSNCWSISHSKKERENSKKRFANRNSKWKSHSRFQRRLKQFITEIKDNQRDDFIAQFFEELNIDIDVAFIDNISITDFVIKKLNSESKTYFIVVDLIDDSKTIAAIIIMLADKTFKHRLISTNNIIVSSNLISYNYNVFIVWKYDDREFKNILIDHDVANHSSKNIEQFTILQRISKTLLTLNKKRIIFFRFDIDEIFSIDTINLKISVDVITFHIVFVHISFLLCFVDMNCLRFYFNNLINMFIKERFSNQIKKIQIQILMSSKSSTRNEKTVFDFQINMNIEHHSTNNSKMMSNLHINMKNEHHSMIRWYDHAFLFWNIFAQLLITESFDQNSCFFIEIELRRFHRRFDHFSTRRLQVILDRFDHEINS
jgi:hypothetical protein